MPNKKTTGRIEIPRDVEGLLDVAQTIYDKHVVDGANSQLNGLQDIDWTKSGDSIAKAKARHKDALMHQMLSEDNFRERDNYLEEVREMVKASTSTLKAQNSKNIKRLGEWGIVVNDTPKVKKAN